MSGTLQSIVSIKKLLQTKLEESLQSDELLMDDRMEASQNQVKGRSAVVERGYRRRGRQDEGPGGPGLTSALHPLFFLPSIHMVPPPCHTSAPSPTVLLCCQITKWLFACYKQRKQILYRYYIYIEMFSPCWDVCIGPDITLMHTLRQYSFNSPTILHTFTYMYTVANSNLWEKVTETHFLSCWKWIYSTRYTSWYCLLLWNPSSLSVF